jgi:hypothetical protein
VFLHCYSWLNTSLWLCGKHTGDSLIRFSIEWIYLFNKPLSHSASTCVQIQPEGNGKLDIFHTLICKKNQHWKKMGISIISHCQVSQTLKMGFGLVIGFIDNLQVITTINYNTVTDLHNLQTFHTRYEGLESWISSLPFCGIVNLHLILGMLYYCYYSVTASTTPQLLLLLLLQLRTVFLIWFVMKSIICCEELPCVLVDVH